LEDINEIQNKIEKVKNYPEKVSDLREQYGKIPQEEYIEKVKNIRSEEDYEKDRRKIKIKYIAHHYYLPLILSETNSTEEKIRLSETNSTEEKISYIRHIIKIPSEVRFVEDLEDYLITGDNKFKELDWWMFSKLDESFDEVYIPYYNPNENKISNFNPITQTKIK